MPCLSPWPPEVYSLLCLRWEKSLPTDLHVLRCSPHSLQEQTPHSQGCGLQMIQIMDAAGKINTKHPVAFWQVSELFDLGTMNLESIFCWDPSSLPEYIPLASPEAQPPLCALRCCFQSISENQCHWSAKCTRVLSYCPVSFTEGLNVQEVHLQVAQIAKTQVFAFFSLWLSNLPVQVFSPVSFGVFLNNIPVRRIVILFYCRNQTL